MSKRRKRSVPVAPPKQEKKMVIDMNGVNRKMQHTVPSFRTGKHITNKDRPRKKNWKREYEKDRESGRYNDTDPGSFLLPGERRKDAILHTGTDREGQADGSADLPAELRAAGTGACIGKDLLHQGT